MDATDCLGDGTQTGFARLRYFHWPAAGRLQAVDEEQAAGFFMRGGITFAIHQHFVIALAFVIRQP